MEEESTNKRKASQDEDSLRHSKSNPNAYPRKRVSIACEVCRTRKTRCDARKPACSLCTELEIECVYKKPVPEDKTKDSASDTIIKRLESIEATLESVCRALRLQHQSESAIVDTPYSDASPSLTQYGGPTRNRGSFRGRRRNTCRMPNLLAFTAPSPRTASWSYDCTANFFEDQFDCVADMRQALATDLGHVDLSGPRLWRLKRSFADNVLSWLPLFDHETASEHLRSAQASDHQGSTPSLCLVFFIYAVGSIARDECAYTQLAYDLPGFAYYKRALTMLEKFPALSKDLCILQCRILMAVYLLFAMRPLEGWKAIFQASQDCIVLLRKQIVNETAQYQEVFRRIYWICYILENELEVCLEVPTSGLRTYEAAIPLPTSHYDEDGMYYLLAMSSLRRLMVEVVDAVGLKSSALVSYAPGVALELRSQIDDWYQHLPGSLRFPQDASLLFDTRKAHLRCSYFALIAVVSWPVVFEVEPLNNDDESLTEHAEECLKVCRIYLKAAEEILTQKSLISHLIIRGYFAMTMILLLVYQGGRPEYDFRNLSDKNLLEQALQNLSYWKVVPFLHQPLFEMGRIAGLKGLTMPE